MQIPFPTLYRLSKLQHPVKRKPHVHVKNGMQGSFKKKNLSLIQKKKMASENKSREFKAMTITLNEGSGLTLSTTRTIV